MTLVTAAAVALVLASANAEICYDNDEGVRRCEADGEYYACGCGLCTLHRLCSSNSGLGQCACPAGVIKDSSSPLFLYVPLSAEWWTQPLHSGHVVTTGFFFIWNIVIWPQVWALLFFLYVTVKARGCYEVLVNGSLCHLAFMAPFGIPGMLMPLGSGPVGLIAFIPIGYAFSFVYKNRSQIQSQPNARAVQRQTSNPRTLAHGIPIAEAQPVDSDTLSDKLRQADEALELRRITAAEHAELRARIMDTFANAASVVTATIVHENSAIQPIPRSV